MNQSLSARAAPPIWMLALAVSGANVGMSLLSPAVPDLRDDLLATADEAQLVLSGFLVMLGLGQLGAGEIVLEPPRDGFRVRRQGRGLELPE